MSLFKLKDADVDHTEFWLEINGDEIILKCKNKEIESGREFSILAIDERGSYLYAGLNKDLGFSLTSGGHILTDF